MENGSLIIGIDLGTTNSVCAYLGPEGPQLIPNALGHMLTPSVVAVDSGGEILVGAAAREVQVVHPERCASLFKRRMGTEHLFRLADREFSPEQLSSLVLRSLKDDAEAHLGKPVTRAVITVPAYFNDDQRKATIQAGRMAGLTVERIINEPTAAAIAYGLHESAGEKVIVVFDLGGGTFDVSVVDLFEGAVEVRASSGECFLGGEDFTRALAARVLEQAGELYERAEMQSPHLVSRLLQLCERAKLQLSRAEQTTVAIPDRQGHVDENARQVTVTREQFQQWTEHVLAGIELPIRRGLGDAGLKRTDIDEVILVGGATRMPGLVQRIRDIFQKEPQCRLNPDEVVALGAAVQAGLIAREKSVDDLVVTDVCPFTLGVEISKKLGMELRDGYFMPVINRNTTIPCSRVERVTTLHGNQTEIRVKVYQGESRRVKDNLLLGEFLVKGIPRGPAGQEIDLRFTYDLNGVLEVEAKVVETQKASSIVITRHIRPGFSEAQIAQAVEQMQALKHHPREEAVNRFLIKRAERVYRELPLMERELLMELIDGFEDALNLQDEEAIDRHRARLEEILDRFEEGHFDDLDLDDDDDEDESWRG